MNPFNNNRNKLSSSDRINNLKNSAIAKDINSGNKVDGSYDLKNSVKKGKQLLDYKCRDIYPLDNLLKLYSGKFNIYNSFTINDKTKNVFLKCFSKDFKESSNNINVNLTDINNLYGTSGELLKYRIIVDPSHNLFGTSTDCLNNSNGAKKFTNYSINNFVDCKKFTDENNSSIITLTGSPTDTNDLINLLLEQLNNHDIKNNLLGSFFI